MALMMYLILGVVALYLFRVNPVLCVGIVGAVVFFKVRGRAVNRRLKPRAGASPATEAALVAMCISLLERSELPAPQSPNWNASPRFPEEDPLGGLFLD